MVMVGETTQKPPEEVVLARIMRLNATLHGIVTGLVLGLGLFVATNWLVLKDGDVVGPHLGLLGHFFIGYRVTLAGSFVGLAYGFASGFVIGYAVARLYNWLVNLREPQHRSPA